MTNETITKTEAINMILADKPMYKIGDTDIFGNVLTANDIADAMIRNMERNIKTLKAAI